MSRWSLGIGSVLTAALGAYVVIVNARGASRDVLIFGAAMLLIAWGLAFPTNVTALIADAQKIVDMWRKGGSQ